MGLSNLKRVNLTAQEKEVLEDLAGVPIYLRNVVEVNQAEVSQLQEQAKENALVYLQRQQLGQKLSILEENNLFNTVVDLQKTLGLSHLPRRMECYDISHLSGKFVYGSMVTFIDGRPAKKFYRLFKTKEQNNDFANHAEVMRRRFERGLEFELKVKSEKLKVGEGVVANLDSVLESEGVKELRSERVDPAWELPDLIIVDGGKGQLSADYEVLLQYRQKFAEQGLEFSVEMCSLAKREEEIFLPDMSNISAPLGKEGGILLSGQAKFLIQRIRDEAHRFAITNNRNARLRTISKSKLDEIPGVGPTTKEKLLKTFGSVERVMNALDTNQELVLELIGKSLTAKLRKWFGI